MTNQTANLADAIGPELPYLRRYARALTGSQRTGDHYAAATLEALLGDAGLFDRSQSPKVALFKVFHGIWSSTGAPVETSSIDSNLEQQVQKRLSALTPNSREALLLHTVESLPLDSVANVMDIPRDEAKELVEIARREMADAHSGKVMIIEDEAIISMDLEGIVSEMGHKVTGIAKTHKAAVKLGHSEVPDLILADIQLADNSSGIDAVNELLTDLGQRPVIFITAFPERLLTGERPEPAFLISKPYNEEQVRSAVSQALFFASTETLTV
ncbi:response regulator [Pseudaestuariivita rosea]|uniref:response regulator n=1 Tax=Pseudaestuariivita rosea TaxID=2763263 RepID=UPI001ABA808C|nr:response regulator [Pseudaestuariivita rosea]